MLNFKVVIVPDNKTAKKVPKIPGLLEYRLDQKKLYVRANETWNILPQEIEVRAAFATVWEYVKFPFHQCSLVKSGNCVLKTFIKKDCIFFEKEEETS